MRVGFLSHEYPPLLGGASAALQALTGALCARGHTVRVVTIGLGDALERDCDRAGREVVRLGAGRSSLLAPTASELVRSYVALRQWAPRLLRRFEPDIVVAFFAFPAGHIAVSRAVRTLGPVVVSLRGSDVPGFSSGRWGVGKVLRPMLLRPVWAKADQMVANGRRLASLGSQVAKREVSSHPNGVNTALYHPPERGRSGPVRVLSVGQLIERKRHEAVLDAVGLLGQEGYESRVTIAGDGPLRGRLEEVAGRTSNAGVTVTGAVSGEEMPQLYRSHDVLVHLSSSEGVSNVVLEGLASGLHVIATPAGGGEVLEGTEAGELLESADAETVARALSPWLERTPALTARQEAARELAQRWSWDTAAWRLESLMRDLSGV